MTAAIGQPLSREQSHPHDYQGLVPERLPAQVIRQLSVLEPRKVAMAIAAEWASILAAIGLSVTVRHPLVYAAAVVWIGARQHALTVLGHDAAHYRLLPDRRWNDWVANLATQWPMFLTVEGFRHYHGEHHRFLGSPADGNRRIWRTHTADGFPTAEWTFPKTLPALVLTVLLRAAFLTGIFWIVRGLVAAVLFRRSWTQVAARLAFYGAAAWVLVAAGALRGFFLYWIVPYCTWHIACQYIRLICEHSEAYSADPAYTLTRTTLARRWERCLIVPRNIHYHIEHHWYPSVPFYNLPALHARLMERPEFRNRAVVTTSVAESLRQCLAR
jgi:fatty acid desaturase